MARNSAGAHDEAARILTPVFDCIWRHCETCRAGRLDHMVSALLSAAGSARLALGASDDARDVLEQGLALAAASGLGREQTRFLLKLGETEHAAGQHAKALDRLQAALSLAEQLSEPDLVAQCYLRLSRALETQGNFAGALAHFHRYHDKHVGVLRTHAAMRAQVLAIQLDDEHSGVEAELLRLRATELERDNRSLISQTEQLSRHANEDPLTGLGNRRYFSLRMAQLREAGNADTHSVVIAIADIDHFKQVNDRFSHAVGDLVLQQVGALFREHCRPQDVVARFGGEEFVVRWAAATWA